MQKRLLISVLVTGLFSTLPVLANTPTITGLKVINQSSGAVHIHQGGYAPSQIIAPGNSVTLQYPFTVIPPNSVKSIRSSQIVATIGGKWVTTPNGFTYLKHPELLVCLDYSKANHASKSGLRTWTITSSTGKQANCQVKGFKQLWWQPQHILPQ